MARKSFCDCCKKEVPYNMKYISWEEGMWGSSKAAELCPDCNVSLTKLIKEFLGGN